jgi:hypothetical protein
MDTKTAEFVMRDLNSRILCVVLAGLMAVDLNLVQWQFLAAQEPPARDLPAKAGPQRRRRQAEEMERRLRAMEAAQHEIPRETFDPQAIVDKVGRDPNKLFAWVRDHTYWVPYQGALRGPTGVLMDRLGGTLDRAFLLAELVRLAGQEVRLVHAELTEAQARQLLTQLRPVPREMPPMASPPTHEAALKLVDKYAKEFQLDGVSIRKNLEKDWQASTRIREELGRRRVDQVPRLAQAVGKPTEKAVDASVIPALRDHWWVQWRDQGAWVELDPLLPETPPGRVTGQAKASLTLAPKDGKLLLAGRFCHEVHLRVIVERWQAGKLKEQTVLQHTLRPYQLFQDRIILHHMPLGWPADLDLLRKQEQHRLQKAVLERHEWLPMLSIGTSHMAQASFTDTGEIHSEGLKIFAGGLEKAVQGFDPFKALPRPGTKPPPNEAGRLTAQWIDYEIRAPGRPVRTIRRQVFDLLGPAARQDKIVPEPAIGNEQRLERGLALLGETEVLLQVCRLSPDFVEHLVTAKMLANRKVFPELLRKGDGATNKELRDLLGKYVPLPGHLHSLALLRGEFSRVGQEMYLDRPNILSYHVGVRAGPGGQILLHQGLDIVANEVAVRPGSTIDPFLVRLEQGIMDTNVEALVLGGQAAVENTAELFVPREPGEKWLTIRDRLDPAWRTVQLSKDVRARIEQDLASGYVVLVPEKSLIRHGHPQVGWWRVDPRAGHVLGVGAHGWGGSEFSLQEQLGIGGVVVVIVLVLCLKYTNLGDGIKTLLQNAGCSVVGRGAAGLGCPP